jgi:hypothetical protein
MFRVIPEDRGGIGRLKLWSIVCMDWDVKIVVERN